MYLCKYAGQTKFKLAYIFLPHSVGKIFKTGTERAGVGSYGLDA
jgi:hypothetical protein